MPAAFREPQQRTTDVSDARRGSYVRLENQNTYSIGSIVTAADIILANMSDKTQKSAVMAAITARLSSQQQRFMRKHQL